MANEQLQEQMMKAANRLAKWRMILAGWQLGTRPKGNPESDAVRDHREATLLLRAEVSALTNLLITSGLVSEEDALKTFTQEYEALEQDMQRRFPGAKATDEGMSLDPQVVQSWMQNFPD